MTRQRIRPSLERSVYKDCPVCTGTGVVKSTESVAIEAFRLMLLASHRDGTASVTLTVADDVAEYLNNRKRRELAALEDQAKITAQVLGKEDAPPDHMQIVCKDGQGRELKFPAGN